MTDLRQQLSTRKRGRRSFAGYMRFMRSLACPVYMQDVHPRIPTSCPFPLDDVLERFGRCFTSTAAYMVALAVIEGVDALALWGVEARGQEYRYQRPALKYLLGVAKQSDIDIALPVRSSLQPPDDPEPVYTPVLYAYDWRSPRAWWRYRLKWRAARRRRLLRQKARGRRLG